MANLNTCINLFLPFAGGLGPRAEGIHRRTRMQKYTRWRRRLSVQWISNSRRGHPRGAPLSRAIPYTAKELFPHPGSTVHKCFIHRRAVRFLWGGA